MIKDMCILAGAVVLTVVMLSCTVGVLVWVLNVMGIILS